ncbi:MAG: hypothetical protein CMD45_01290 [Gammaproteobacteria bacterium]|nr:hypothetical protein [Gammaproteobacteria bacterium]
MKKILLTSLILFSFNTFGEITPEIKALKDNPNSVLFIGNSYLYYNDSLHNHFKNMANERFAKFDGSKNVKSATIGGSRLKHHDVERLIQPLAISSIEKFDLVILQGGSGEVLLESDRIEFNEVARQHIETIRSKDIEPALYMTHAYTESHKNYAPNLIRSIEEMYTFSGNANQALVIPVGLAFEAAYKERPDIKLHKLDGTHPDLLGTYLAACTVFASVFGESPVGINYDYNGSVSADDKLFLQKIAQLTVNNYYGLSGSHSTE